MTLASASETPKNTKQRETTKPKATINLGNILKPAKPVSIPEKENEVITNRDFSHEELVGAWQEFAEMRKNHLAEYHLLGRGFEREGNMLVIHLANPVEEPLMLGLKNDLITFIREKVGNSALQVTGRLQDIVKQKVAYTSKEKFDVMAQQNPMLLHLKDRFGLDADF